jgi:phage terminase large subunit-like protein
MSITKSNRQKILNFIRKKKAIQKARRYKKRFIPLEKIARDPKKYGFSKVEQFDSNAKQEEFIKSRKKINSANCSNRAGKTEAMTIALIDIAEESLINGTIWVFSESYDAQLDGIQTKFEDYLKDEQILDVTWAKKGVWGRIKYRTKKGKIIDFAFKTYEQGRAKVQSAKLIAAGFDEEPPEDIFDEVYTRCIDLNAPIFLAFTPLKGLTWTYDAIWLAAQSDPDIYVCNWGMADNPFIPRSEIEMCKRRWSKKKCMMRLYGLYTGSEDQVFDSFDRERHLKPGLYDPKLPVHVCVDWGVRFAAVIFAQVAKVSRQDGTMYNEIREIKAAELYGAGYGHVMDYIREQEYQYVGYYCDPAGTARSQATRSGISLLDKIKLNYGIQFTYIRKLGIEEGISIVEGKFENSLGEISYYIDQDIKWSDPEGKVINPSMRIEGYVRDKKTRQPVKDGENDHMNDCRRYLVANIDAKDRQSFKQH